MDSLSNWTKTHFTNEIVPALDGKKVTLMGWLRDVRLHGNLAFLVLADREGDAQVTVLKKNAPKAFEKLSEITRESAVAVKGTVKKTDKTNRGVEVILDDILLRRGFSRCGVKGDADLRCIHMAGALEKCVARFGYIK